MARKNKYKDMRTVSLTPVGTRPVGSAAKNNRKHADYRSIGKATKANDSSSPKMVTSSAIQKTQSTVVTPLKETKVSKPAKTPKPPKPPKPPKTPKEPKEPRDWKWLKILLAVLLGIAVIVGIVFGVRALVQQNAAKKAAEETTEATTTAVVEETTTKVAAAATEFVVNEEYISKHDYCIAVNTSQNLVVVYTKDENNQYTVPYKAFLCSCGDLKESPTATGAFVTESRQSWRWQSSGEYTQYATCVDTDNRIWFQSVPYFSQDPSDLDYEVYNQLGTNVSDGTIYMTVRGAKWIYDNCGLGTEVVLYTGKKVTEPFKAPTLKRVNSTDESTRGWDPTDPDPSNPWNPKTATKVVNTIPTTTAAPKTTAASTETYTTGAQTKASSYTTGKATARATTRATTKATN